MTDAVLLHVLELLVEAETSLRFECTPVAIGNALGCLTSVRAHVEAALEVAAKEESV